MPRRHYEVKDQLDQVEKAKRRLEEEAGTLRASVEAGRDDDGTRERLSNLEQVNLHRHDLHQLVMLAADRARRGGHVGDIGDLAHIPLPFSIGKHWVDWRR